MSKSYKYPIFTEQHSGKQVAKRHSNKRLRKYLKTISKGFKSSIIKKKLSDPWNICDYKFDPTTPLEIKKSKRK